MWNMNGHNTTAGGFLNNTTTDLDSPAKKKGTGKRLQSVVPVVVRQIRDHQDDEFKLFGSPAPILTLVGILRDYEVQSTKATYNIEDHTGSIKAIWWLDSDSDSTPNLPAVKEGCYVQVFGSLRSQDGDKMIMVLRMFLVEDANIITSHLLQVIHARLKAESLSQNLGMKVKADNPGLALANSMSFMDENNAGGDTNTFTPLQQKLFDLLASNTSASGTDRRSILNHFPPAQHRDVNESLDFLVSEGHVYSTIDNDHFKATTIF